MPFLLVAFVTLIGFSFALFTLFGYRLLERRDEKIDDELNNMMKDSFEDPFRAMVTMFDSMVGTFESKIYYNSGRSFFLVDVFVFYLVIQMLIILNTIIAAMGDTYDRVKSTQEEQLLWAKAIFIDDCEAGLSKEEIDESIGKYLYVLLFKDEDMTKEVEAWYGRIKTLEESIGRKIKKSHQEAMSQMEKYMIEIRRMKEDINEFKDIKKDINEIKQMKEDINEIKLMIANKTA